MTRALLTVAMVLALVSAPSSGEDLRKKYDTASVEAAARVERAGALAGARRWPEALEQIDAAVAADPACAWAHWRRGGILAALGKVAEGLQAWARAWAFAPDSANAVTVNAAIDAGGALTGIGRYDEARLWFSRAILADPNNLTGLRGKAWRDMAECCRAQKQNLAASLAGLAACMDDPGDVELKNFVEEWKRGLPVEAARLLCKPYEIPTFRPRDAARLVPIPIEGDADVTDPVSRLMADPKGGGIVALVAGKPYYYYVGATEKLSIRKVGLPGEARCSAVAGGRLYVMCANPYLLYVMDVATGKCERSYDVGWRLPSSLAPFPSQAVVYFATDLGHVYRLDLVTGAVADTGVPGHRIASDPGESYLFATFVPSRAPKDRGSVLINGEAAPLPLHAGGYWPDYAAVLIKYLAVRGELLAADVRVNAQLDGEGLSVSADGQWVTVTSEAGWTRNEQRKDPPGLGLLSAHNIEYRHAFYGASACPWNVAMNPITGQAAISHSWYVCVVQTENAQKDYVLDSYVRDKTGKDVRTPPGVFLEGMFAPPMTWSPNGEYLVVGKAGGGLCAYVNTLSDAEKRLALSWSKDLWPEARPLPPAAAGPVDLPPPAPPIPALADFKTTNSRPAISAEILQAIIAGRAVRPPSWDRCRLYARNDQFLAGLERFETEQSVTQLWDLPRGMPEAPWRNYLFAISNQHDGRHGDAQNEYLACVRTDRGRTDLTPAALNALAAEYGDRNAMVAIYCLAASLQADRGNPETLKAIYPRLKAAKFDAEAATLVALYPQILLAPPVLPRLAIPGVGAEALAPDQLYARAAPSIVIIRSRRACGTGFCAGEPGVLLTDERVTGGQATVDVYAFRLEEGIPVRTDKLVGEVVARGRGIAVVRLVNPPPTMKALDVAASSPIAGERIFAIGNPSMGIQVLEQSISEGIISSVNRSFGSSIYLQHTAAISSGSRGGPLLNEKGQVVGMNTLTTGLEGVGFAIPVEDIRRLPWRP